ncbi:ABC transporter permease [Clostridium grantii]|uniref:Putative ABC transport system permease protein n=1 Tax=Clostridium grantii DSM 8605 TaxID=1121316 RepID=A0A1M5TLF8_9CLOT|nr:ABC transporter permease [Clostridium grantii]SHH51602.1 putative ABC transport system permease protein [Clostridium grantii DSM 8605]
MGTKDIGYGSLLMLLILVVPIMAINWKMKLKINKSLTYSIVRMLIQLSLVGIYLQYIFTLNNSFLNIAYLIVMIVVASVSTINSSKLKLKKFFFPIFFSILIPQVIILLYFNCFIVRLDNVFDAKYMIPIGGMILGNCLSGNIVGLNSFYYNIKNNENQYIYSITLGATKVQALIPYFREAILGAINPTIASMATIGLVSLPGMMTGQILGGSVPLVAIKYQIAIMLAIFIAKYFSTMLSIIFSVKKSFNDFNMLQKNVFL